MASDPRTIEIIYHGPSMDSLFIHGQKIHAQLDFDLVLGGIYIFKYLDELTIHRLIHIEENKYIFKGDFSLKSEIVSKDQIIAKVSSKFENQFLTLNKLYSDKKPRLLRYPAKLGMKILSKIV